MTPCSGSHTRGPQTESRPRLPPPFSLLSSPSFSCRWSSCCPTHQAPLGTSALARPSSGCTFSSSSQASWAALYPNPSLPPSLLCFILCSWHLLSEVILFLSPFVCCLFISSAGGMSVCPAVTGASSIWTEWMLHRNVLRKYISVQGSNNHAMRAGWLSILSRQRHFPLPCQVLLAGIRIKWTGENLTGENQTKV